MSLKDIFNISKIKEENVRLNKIVADLKGLELIDIIRKMEESTDQLNKIESVIETKKKNVEKIESDVSMKKKELIEIEEELMLESFALYKPKYDFSTSAMYKDRLTQIRQNQKDMIKSKIAVTGNMNWTVNGKKAQGKKMVNDMIKLVTRAFNNECDDAITKAKFNNIESCEKRINKSYEALNKLGKIMQVMISSRYKSHKFEELYLAHEYRVKKQEEKEEQKEIRARLREEAKLQKEIEEARKKVYKEQNHYKNALGKLEKQLAMSSDSERQELENKIKEIKDHLNIIDDNLRDIDYREANHRAGYVYVISNVGSFGESIYKIGMTRRLEPLDRVHELGGASVPFNFDLHALIFSDDAPTLENSLHKAFDDRKINMVNTRREFFKVSLEEIEEVVKKNHDKTVDFKKLAPAEQYRESLIIREKSS